MVGFVIPDQQMSILRPGEAFSPVGFTMTMQESENLFPKTRGIIGPFSSLTGNYK